MKRFMTGAGWSATPKGLVSVLTGLIACAWAFGIAPLSAHAQGRWGYGWSVTVESELIPGAQFFALPTENGRLKWPIGLWLVSGESAGSRDQLELAMNYATKQAAEGRVNHVVIDFGLDAVDDLRQQLQPHKGMMSPQGYAEAMRFLNRAERGFTRMKRMVSGPRGAYADSGISGDGVASGRLGERQLSSHHAAERRMGLARQAFWEGDYAEAQRECERAIRLRPRDANLRELLALCQFAQGSYKDAAANLYEVLPTEPRWDWDSLMSFYPSTQTYTRQLRALEQDVRENPEDAAGRFVLAYHYLTLDERDAAVGQLRRVIQLEPRDRVSPGLLEELEKAKEGARHRADAAGD